MRFAQIVINSIILPSARVDAPSIELRDIALSIHNNSKKFVRGRTLDTLYRFGSNVADLSDRKMSAIDRADLTFLLGELGWNHTLRNGSMPLWRPPESPRSGSGKRRAKRRSRQRSRGR